MSAVIIIFALVANIATIVLWRTQRSKQGAIRLLIVALGVIAFLTSCVLLAIPYAWTRAPFIALGVLGLSGWLCVFGGALLPTPKVTG